MSNKELPIDLSELRKTKIALYIADLKDTNCNELRYLIEIFLSQNPSIKAKVDEIILNRNNSINKAKEKITQC